MEIIKSKHMLTTNSVNCRPSFKGRLSIGAKTTKALEQIGKVSSVHQRAIQGVAALGITTLIDRHNPWTDEETRKTSAIRTGSKALVCASTGVAIRYLSSKWAKTILDKISIDKMPKFIIKTQEGRDYASKVIGVVAALGVMVFTNFLIDAPLTNKLTNFLIKKNKKRENFPQTKENADAVVFPQKKETQAAPQNDEIKSTAPGPSPVMSRSESTIWFNGGIKQ